MKNQSALIAGLVALIIGGCLWLIVNGSNPPIRLAAEQPVANVNVPSIANTNSETQAPAVNTINNEPLVARNDSGLNCEQYQDRDFASDLYSDEQWQESLGYRTDSGDRSYYEMDAAQLEALVVEGDGQAALALGLNLRAQTYGLGQTWPTDAFYTIAALSPPPDAILQQELLDRSRELLFQAAVLGKPAALTDLALSYSEELSWRESNNTLTDQIESNLRMKIFIYSQMQAPLFNDSGDASAVPPTGKEKEAQARFDIEMNRFENAQYKALGEVPAFNTPVHVEVARSRISQFFEQCEQP